MGELVDGADIVQRRPAMDAQSTPIHRFAVFDQFDGARCVCGRRAWWRAAGRRHELREGNLNGSYLAAAFALASAPPDPASLARLVAAGVDLDPCLRLLDVSAAHEVALIHVLAHVDQVVGLIQTVDVDNLHAELLDDVGPWLGVEGDSLADGEVRADGAFETVLNHEVHIQIKLDRVAKLSRILARARIWVATIDGLLHGRHPSQDDRQITLSVVRLDHQGPDHHRGRQEVNAGVSEEV